jgi:hypothetical protein
MLTQNSRFCLLLISLLSLIVATSTLDGTQYEFPVAVMVAVQNAADDSPVDHVSNLCIDCAAFFAFCARPGVTAAKRTFAEKRVHNLTSLLFDCTPSLRAPPAWS